MDYLVPVWLKHVRVVPLVMVDLAVYPNKIPCSMAQLRMEKWVSFWGLHLEVFIPASDTSSVTASSSRSQYKGQGRGYGEGFAAADVTEKIQTIYDRWLPTSYTADT